ncbi:hypothetical protein [Photobacterium iliopiscarium]|nr:hypothetical protein [Photobacterium iliopiscarium]MCD9468843.1 hypothetical protein [Photobacterium iliopiscarium]
MLLEIDDSVFITTNNNFLSLVSSSAIYNKIYVYYDKEKPLFSSWISAKSIEDKATWDTILDATEVDMARYNLENKATVSNIPSSLLDEDIPIYSIDDAAKVINLPFMIYLENGRADNGFIKSTLSSNDRVLVSKLEMDEKLHFQGK